MLVYNPSRLCPFPPLSPRPAPPFRIRRRRRSSPDRSIERPVDGGVRRQLLLVGVGGRGGGHRGVPEGRLPRRAPRGPLRRRQVRRAAVARLGQLLYRLARLRHPPQQIRGAQDP